MRPCVSKKVGGGHPSLVSCAMTAQLVASLYLTGPCFLQVFKCTSHPFFVCVINPSFFDTCCRSANVMIMLVNGSQHVLKLTDYASTVAVHYHSVVDEGGQ